MLLVQKEWSQEELIIKPEEDLDDKEMKVVQFLRKFEDDLMRIFGSESMNNILKKLGLKDSESIDHPWINKALERAQQKVESRNFDIRKALIKFDNVLNDQRHVIFSQRNEAMNSEKIFQYSEDFLQKYWRI